MTGTPRQRLPAEQRRDQLLDAVVAAAGQGSLAAVSVEQIAALAGVSEGLLYHYFSSRDDLVLATVRRAADGLLTELRAAAERPPAERLLAGLDAYLDHVTAQPASWRALLQANSGDLAAVTDELHRHVRSLFLEALKVEQSSPTLTATITSWMALERELCAQWLEQPSIDRATIQSLLISSFLAMLQAGAATDEVSAGALRTVQAAFG